MGVARFFRWVAERFPLVLEQINEEQIPEFDCLYLDMNGIIHNCSHGNGGVDHMTEDDIWEMVFNYINHLVYIIKPRKLLYMAVDGVAPRAKMNQQRSRRFRAAHDAAEARAKADSIKAQQQRRGTPQAPSKPKLQFDSNCITPGTAFMQRLGEHMDFFVQKKIHEDPLWKSLNVILSGPDVPGEGEHKIMEYIRAAKTQDGYEPNLRHCIYGLDADLIMLSLASHEPHFSLLREEVIFDRAKNRDAAQSVLTKTDSFQLLHICLYREYLALEILEGAAPISKPPPMPIKDHPSTSFFHTLAVDGRLSKAECLERVVDDFILFCFMIGNDFLPHLHFAEIGDGGLAQLIKIYKDHLRVNGIHPDGFISRGEGEINWGVFFKLFGRWAAFEEEKLFDAAGSKDWLNLKYRTLGKDRELFPEHKRAEAGELMTLAGVVPPPEVVSAGEATNYPLSAPAATGDEGWKDSVRGGKQKGKKGSSFVSLRASMDDWYEAKLGVDCTSGRGKNMVDNMILEYLKGLQWVLYYYFKGVPSWDWFYPSHYAPWAADVVSSRFAQDPSFKVTFDVGTPFLPFQQLMSVMPPECSTLLPPLFRPLMTQARSAIKDFYPETIQIDMEGVKVEWGGTILVPFIDSKRLINSMDKAVWDAENVPPFTQTLTDKEKMRNRNTTPFLYRRDPNASVPVASTLAARYPSIAGANVLKFAFNLPQIPHGRRANVRLPLTLDSVPGFPSLHSHRVRPKYDQGVKQFQMESRSESLFLSTSPWSALATPQGLESILSAEVIQVDWPYVHLAQLEALVLPHFTIDVKNKVVIPTAFSHDRVGQASAKAMEASSLPVYNHPQLYAELTSNLRRRGIYVAESADRDSLPAPVGERTLQSFDADQEDDGESILAALSKGTPVEALLKGGNHNGRGNKGGNKQQAVVAYPAQARQLLEDEFAVAKGDAYSIDHPLIKEGLAKFVLPLGPAPKAPVQQIVAVVRAVTSVGMVLNPTTRALEFIKTLSKETRSYPFLHTLPIRRDELPHWASLRANEEVRPDSEVLLLGPKTPLFGSVGHVKAVRGGKVDVEVIVKEMGDLERVSLMVQDRVRQAIKKARDDEVYYTYKQAADQTGLNERTISQLVGQVFVSEMRGQTGFPGKENMGMNLVIFLGGRGGKGKVQQGPPQPPMVAPGYARANWVSDGKKGGRWVTELSGEAIAAIMSYKETFPNVVNAIATYAQQTYSDEGSNDRKGLNAKGLFAQSSDPNYELGMVAGWLSKQTFKTARLVPGSHCLVAPKQGVTAVVDLIDKMAEQLRHSTDGKTETQVVYTASVELADLRPLASTAPFPTSLILPQPVLGQRVIFVKAEGAVPVGSRGTVVGLLGAKRVRASEAQGSGGFVGAAGDTVMSDLETVVEIVLDKAYLGADSLHGRCPPRRGLLVAPEDIVPLYPHLSGQTGAMLEGGNGTLPAETVKSSRKVPLQVAPDARDLVGEFLRDEKPEAPLPVRPSAPANVSLPQPMFDEDEEDEKLLISSKRLTTQQGAQRNTAGIAVHHTNQVTPNASGVRAKPGMMAGFGVNPATAVPMDEAQVKQSRGKAAPAWAKGAPKLLTQDQVKQHDKKEQDKARKAAAQQAKTVQQSPQVPIAAPQILMPNLPNMMAPPPMAHGIPMPHMLPHGGGFPLPNMMGFPPMPHMLPHGMPMPMPHMLPGMPLIPSLPSVPQANLPIPSVPPQAAPSDSPQVDQQRLLKAFLTKPQTGATPSAPAGPPQAHQAAPPAPVPQQLSAEEEQKQKASKIDLLQALKKTPAPKGQVPPQAPAPPAGPPPAIPPVPVVVASSPPAVDGAPPSSGMSLMGLLKKKPTQ